MICKIPDGSKESIIESFVNNQLIDEDGHILKPGVFELANFQLSEDILERYNIKGYMFTIEDGRAVFNESLYARINTPGPKESVPVSTLETPGLPSLTIEEDFKSNCA